MHIPDFPEFGTLAIEHRDVINQHAAKFSPYSDFNFTSLLSWDNSSSTKLSILNGNLVVMFDDYTDPSASFISLLGDESVNQTIEVLLKYAESHHNLSNKLHLIGEEIITYVDTSLYTAEEDDDNHDYVIDIADFIRLPTNKHRGKKNELNRFYRFYGDTSEIKTLNLRDTVVQQDIRTLANNWAEKRGGASEFQNELNAISRHLALSEHLIHISCIGVYIESKLRAFATVETIHDTHPGFSILHFEKADTEFIGIFTALNIASYKYLYELGCKWINIEQDLGIPNLRRAKQLAKPSRLLKKYVVSRASEEP